ncbi:MAG: insulinase family protein [Alphaproteobacteria bacterium]|nr:insulinase family protein [Alphaproteobacteria bacterium]
MSPWILLLAGCWTRAPGPVPLDLAADPVPMVQATAERSRVDLVVTLRAGAALDPVGQEGLAWLTAQTVALGGAGGRGADDTADALYRLGTQVRVVVGPELVALHLPCALDAVAECAALLADMVAAPDLDPAVFERVRAQAIAGLEERALGPAPELAATGLLRAVYAGHPYGHGPDGRLGSLPTLQLSDVRAFRTAHWVRPAALIGIAGTVPKDVANQLQDGVSRLPPTLPLGVTALGLPKTPGRRVIHVQGAPGIRSHVAAGHAVDLAVDDPQRLALDVGLAVLGGPAGGRLDAVPELAAASPRLALDGADVRALRQQPALRLDLSPGEDADPVGLAVLALDALGAAAAQGVTPEEVAAEVGRRLTVLDAQTDAAPGRAHMVAVAGLLGAPGPAALRTRLQALDAAAVNAALAAHVHVDDVRIVVVGPGPAAASPVDLAPPADAVDDPVASGPATLPVTAVEETDAASVQGTTLSAQELLR